MPGGAVAPGTWAVSGRLAAGGHPLLANDPHLALDAPSTFYPIHLQAGATDVEGNIAYFTSAELPLREDLQAGAVNGLPPFFIRNGTGGNEWLAVSHAQPGQAIPYEILLYAEMPQIVNPPAGFFVNANNDPAGVSLDNDVLNQQRPGGGIYYLNAGYDGIRAGRITALLRAELAGDGTVSFADSQRIQADTALVDGGFFVPHGSGTPSTPGWPPWGCRCPTASGP
jgi:acyl-homoserine lactone acylase PvdQ